MAQRRRIKVKGIRKTEDVQMLSLALWLGSKRALAEKREREAREKAKREERRQ
jgi:hypothetical protein